MRIRFSIRDLLWLTLVAALAAGWWLDRSKLIGEIDRLKWGEIDQATVPEVDLSFPRSESEWLRRISPHRIPDQPK